MVGRLILQQGEEFSTNMELKTKLEAIWGIKEFKLIRMQGGSYHILLWSVEDQGAIMVMGVINIKAWNFSTFALVT